MKFRNFLSLFVILSIAVFIQITFAQNKLKANLYDSYNYFGAEDGNREIGMFSDEVKKSPSNTAYIILYGGRINKLGELDAHLKGIGASLFYHGVEERKTVFVKGGFREKLSIDFWIVPENACPPLPTPTIDFEKVRFRGFSRKIVPYLCC